MHGFDASVSNVPAFLVKLWKLVEDPSTDDLVSWSERGNSFIIKDQATFAKELLPQYFKHNNMASFIRQLNMYGFRKLTNFEKCGLKVENQEMEFCNPFFLKGKVMMLDCIKRKISSTTKPPPETPSANPKDILTDLTSIREKQESMNSLLVGMKKENELLWRELSSLRKKHKTQEQIIQKVIQFLVSIVQSGKPNIGMKRQMARMLHDKKSTGNKKGSISRQLDVVRGNQPDFFITSVQDKITSPIGPVIHEVTDLDHEEASTAGLSECDDDLNESPDSKSEAVADEPLSSPASESLGPLSLFTPFHARAQLLYSAGDENEEVLGLPSEFPSDDIPVPDIASVVSISHDGEDASSETEDQSGVILLPESVGNEITITDDVSNVISIPDDESALSVPEVICQRPYVLPVENADLISSESSAVIPHSQNKASEASQAEAALFPTSEDHALEVASPSGAELSLSSDIIPFSPSFSNLFSPKSVYKEPSSEKNSDWQSCIASPSSSSTATSVQKIETPNNSGSTSMKLCTVKKDPFLNTKPEYFASKSKDRQLAVSEVSPTLPTETTITKNTFSNHVLSVEEELDWLQDQLTSGSLNLDSSLLLGLFSTDDAANNVALANQLASDNGVLRDADMNVIGNELVQFNPSTLDMSFDDGLLDCLTTDAHNVSKSVKKEVLDGSTNDAAFNATLANIKKEKVDDDDYCVSNCSSNVSGPPQSKRTKVARAKSRRKMK